MHADHQFIVPTDGKPIRGLIQDHVVAATLLTKRDTWLERPMYMQLVHFACNAWRPGEWWPGGWGAGGLWLALLGHAAGWSHQYTMHVHACQAWGPQAQPVLTAWVLCNVHCSKPCTAQLLPSYWQPLGT